MMLGGHKLWALDNGDFFSLRHVPKLNAAVTNRNLRTGVFPKKKKRGTESQDAPGDCWT
jgi:hypothetical protein